MMARLGFEAVDLVVIKTVRDAFVFHPLQFVDLLLLTIEMAGVFEVGFE